MPKYYTYKIFGYYLYFTASCVIEAMHVHANDDGKLSRKTAAKFFVKSNGDTTVEKLGTLSDRDIVKLQGFIKEHYLEMYKLWSTLSDNGFYEK